MALLRRHRASRTVEGSSTLDSEVKGNLGAGLFNVRVEALLLVRRERVGQRRC